MSKLRIFILLMILPLITRCDEDDLDLRGTSPVIKLSVFVDQSLAMPDSIAFPSTDSIRTFTDTLRSYLLPVNNNSEATSYNIFVTDTLGDHLLGELILFYDLELIEDVDRIRYIAFLNAFSYRGIDSVAVSECKNILGCTTDETTISIFF